jgi:hypothetical protein
MTASATVQLILTFFIWLETIKEKGLTHINMWCRLQNICNQIIYTLLKQLNKFYAQADIPWCNLVWFKYYQDRVPHGSREVGSFWWKDIQRLNGLYQGTAQCNLGKGNTVMFWQDLWTDSILAHQFPRLFSFARDYEILVNKLSRASAPSNGGPWLLSS